MRGVRRAGVAARVDLKIGCARADTCGVTGARRYSWAAHPWQARGLRVLVYALPIAGSLMLLRLAVSVMGPPTESL